MTFQKSLWETAEPYGNGNRFITLDKAIAAFWNRPVEVKTKSGSIRPLDKPAFAKVWSALRKRLKAGEERPSWVDYLANDLTQHLCRGAKFSSIVLDERKINVIAQLAAAKDMMTVPKPFRRPDGLTDETIEAEWAKPRMSGLAKLHLGAHLRNVARK
jgi:hypothetical protein